MPTKKIVVTSALPYANGPIHIGHLVEYIQTDIFVRLLKLLGKDAIYCCADDTHGTPIEINSKKLGVTPEQLIKKYYNEHTKDFRDFLIEFDNYYSTNSKENKHYSDLIFSRLTKNGFIYEKEIELTYCAHCKRFLPDRFVKGKCPKCGVEDQYGDVCEKCNSAYKTTDLIDPYCSICSNKPERKKSKHFFFKLSNFSAKLKKWLTGNKKLQPEVVNHCLEWIKNGLEDWDISRDGPYFGFKIPGSELYYYVWLDAPIGYIASAQNYCDNHGKKIEDYWNKGEIIHFIGKDIIYFHFLFWPAMLMGSDFQLPDNIVVHGFLTVNKQKMSKSRGTFLTARDYLDKKLNPEFLRFYYAANLSHRMTDIDLDLADFKARINTELVGNISNFIYRVLSFCNNFFDSKTGSFEKGDVENSTYIKQIEEKVENIKKNYAGYEFREVIKDILAISQLGNKYFQEKEPWKVVKDNEESAHETISFCANIVKNLVILLKPILPRYCAEIEKQLNLKDLTFDNIDFDLKNHRIKKAEIILQKVEDIKLGEEKEKFESEGFAGKQPQVDKVIAYEVEDKVKDKGLRFYVAQVDNVAIKNKNEGLDKLKKEIENSVKGIDLEKNRIYIESKRLYRGKNFEPPYAYLISLIKEKGKLPTINTAVDSYNPVSVKYLVSVGAHDTAKIKGKVRFKITDGSEKYIPLGGKELENVEPGEYACVDDEHVLCRLDIKQSEFSKVDSKTKGIMVYVQGNKENKDEDLMNGLKEACENIVRFCGGNYKILEETQGKSDFSKLNIKVAKVIEAKDHPDAKKLVVLQIDLGTEKRQIVAGVKGYYSNEELIGKHICVLTNLEHAKLRGVESQGMLLAGDDGKGNIKLLEAPNSKQGSQVYIKGVKPSDKEIKFDEFLKIKIIVKDKKPQYNGKVLKTDKEEAQVDIADSALVR